MFEPITHTLEMDNFIAGGLPIATDALPVAEGEAIVARSLVKLNEGKAAAYTADDATAKTVPYGIAAAEDENGYVAVYMTGEFFAEKLVLPDGVDADTVAPLLRSNGIFLKDMI